MNFEKMDLHDLFVSKMNYDFVNESFEIKVQFVDDISDEIISKKITFENVIEVSSTGFPSVNANCTINSVLMEAGNIQTHLVKMVILTGYGEMPWYYDFECSGIIYQN